jgi:hypothetical protein
MDKPSKEDVKRIARDQAEAMGREVATEMGMAFAVWLSKRPRIRKFPRLARFLYAIGGRK